MADFGLVIFEDIKIKRKTADSRIKNLALKLSGGIARWLFNAGFFTTRLGTRLYLSSCKVRLENGFSCHEPMEGQKVWIIKLPFTAETLSGLNIEYIFAQLEGLCAEKGIRDFLIPGIVRSKIAGGFHIDPDKFIYHRPSGKILLKSLLVSVLEEIYPRTGKRIEQLDIVIVAGADTEEAFTAIRQLEPQIGFITIVAAEKGDIESRFSELFSDTGLAFSVSSEYRNQLKLADLVINLGNPPDISRCRMAKKSLLINLYDSIESSLPGENTVLNDIAMEIGGAAVKELLFELRGYYSKAELNEIILAEKFELDAYEKFTFETSEQLRRELKKAGCRIAGFVGRRGMISLDSVIKAVGNG